VIVRPHPDIALLGADIPFVETRWPSVKGAKGFVSRPFDDPQAIVLKTSDRAQQGFFTIARTCGTCGGTGRRIVTPCPTCSGRGRVQAEKTITVRVPAGIEDGMRLRITGEGEASGDGGPAGDLYVVLSVDEHDVFRRDGTSLHLDLWLSPAQAALGTTVTVPLLGGGQEELEIDAGTQPGTVVKIRGKGLPAVDRRGRGDLLVTVRVRVPRRLDAEQRALYEKLAALDGDETSERGLFDRVKDIFGS